MASDKWKQKVVKSQIHFVLNICILYYCQHRLVGATDTKYGFSSRDIAEIVDYSCFVAFNLDRTSDLQSVFADVQTAFSSESEVAVGYTDYSQLDRITTVDHKDLSTTDVLIFHKRRKDRVCLSTNVRTSNPKPKVSVYTGNVHVSTVIDFINQQCDTYRNKHGHLTVEGHHRQEILRTLFRVEEVSNISMAKLFTDDDQEFCTDELCSVHNKEMVASKLEGLKYNSEKHKPQFKQYQLPLCDKVPYPSKEDFFHKYLKISKPVIFTGAMEKWSARKKWSNNYMRENYGDRKVHIKLTPSGQYEGVDRADQFENFDTFHIPADVKQQLLYPDLVVVRPATADMKLSQFLDIVQQVSNGTTTDFSAYLEYSSLVDILPDLEDDIEEMPFFESMLELKHLNVWLSDGNTLGKLHFDPFDNFLCQISGRKEVILFEPHDNAKLYEAHIQEAMLEYSQTTKRFSKKSLMDSTSMVMSPVDISKPNFKRFPHLADAYPLNCTIDEGEVLFMPAFWWHEVQSYPNKQEGRNLAVNYWYDPFLLKEFPCPECKLDVNPKYRHLL